MKILLIEDEKPARQRLNNLLQDYREPVTVVSELTTVADSVQWLRKYNTPDLIFLDIQLTDGSAFEIFEQIEISCPVIFITAFDQYLNTSFKHNGIDYLLKPVKRDALFQALDRYKKLRTHFTQEIADIIRDIRTNKKEYISRLIVQSRGNYCSIHTGDIAYCTSKNKITTLTTTSGDRFIVEKSLSNLEFQLNPDHFFKLNRNYLTHINAVTSFQQYFRGREIPRIYGKITLLWSQDFMF